MNIRQAIRKALIATGGAALVSANVLASVGPQNPPPPPGATPDYFGVTGNWMYSPQPILSQVIINDPNNTGSGAVAAATTYDYVNGKYTGSVQNVELVSPGANYSSATTVTVVGFGGAAPVTLTPVFNSTNGIIGFNEIPNPIPATGWAGLGSGFGTPMPNTGIRKFVDSLPLVGAPNDLGQQLTQAIPDTTTFPGSDYYEISVVDTSAGNPNRQQLHADLPSTQLRSYVQTNAPSGSAAATPSYLGPVITAVQNRPVRIKLVNAMGIGAKGKPSLPVDHTVMGANNSSDTDNRTSLHLTGGRSPWISDGLPRQWAKPSGEMAPNKGVSVAYVPDMWYDASGKVVATCSGQTTCSVSGASNNPGDGALTYYYTNQETQRMLVYSDHTDGIGRVNNYGGLVGPYFVQDPVEQAMINGGTVNGVTYSAVIPPATDTIPLVIQDKTFVTDNTVPVLNYYGAFASQLNSQDATWRWGSGQAAPGFNGTGDLWAPHVWMPNQNPGDSNGMNAMGRWDYGPWTWPPFVGTTYMPISNPYYDPTCVPNPNAPACENVTIPATPNGNTVSGGALSEPTQAQDHFNDTILVNGTVYPYTNVDPKKYRLRVVNSSNDRMLNLSFVVAASKNSVDTTANGNSGATNNTILCDGSNPAVSPADCTEVKMVPFTSTQDSVKPFPTNWYTYQKGGVSFDGRVGGVFDPSTRGPSMLQIGSEAGFLATPAPINSQPVNYEYNVKNIQITNVKQHALLLAPGERADVVVDFAQFAGATLMLYNDAGAPVPLMDNRTDFYTGDPDNTDTGGSFSTIAGYGPNVHTVMQFRVAGSCSTGTCGTGINQTPAANAGTSQDYLDTGYTTAITGAVQTAFQQSQDTIIVPQAAYNGAYKTNVNDFAAPNAAGQDMARVMDNSITIIPYASTSTVPGTLGTTAVTLNINNKQYMEDFSVDYGRAALFMGTEVPQSTLINQTSIQQMYIDPATEVLKFTPTDGSPVTAAGTDGTQLWKIVHNGIWTHTYNLDAFDAQIINRVGWDGAMYQPEPNEIGWKNTIRVNPLSSTIIAIRPKALNTPFKVPNSHHVLDPSNSGSNFFFNLDPTTGNGSNVTNVASNFGAEYSINEGALDFQEDAARRPFVLAQIPQDPSGLTQIVNANNSVSLSWNDNSMVANWVQIQRDTVGTFSSPNLTTLNAVIPECQNQAGCAQSYTDSSAVAGQAYYYRVMSNSTVGAGDVNGKLPRNITAAVTNNFTGYDNATTNSNWSNMANPLIPSASLNLNPATLTFASQAALSSSAPQYVTVTNNGQGKLLISGVTFANGGANYSVTNGCTVPVAAGASCTIGVVFKPTVAGTLTDTLVITDNSGGTPTSVQSVALSGTGVLAEQLISFGTVPSLTVGTTANLAATASSGLPLTYSTTSSACSVNGSVVSGISAGTCTIVAQQAGNNTYAAAEASVGITVAKGAQTISFGTAPSLTVGGTAQAIATASSSLPVAYSSTTTRVCTVNATTGVVTGVAQGNCIIAANQAGNTNYNAATQVTQTIVDKTAQTITFAAAPAVVVGGTGTARATASSGLAVAYSSLTTGVCTVNGNTGVVTGVTAGTCTIAANQAGNATRAAATQVTQNITVGKGSQTLRALTGPATIVRPNTGTETTTASSGLPVTYSSTTPSICSVNSGTGVVTGVAAGACTIAANQGGNANYNAAPQVTKAITIR